MTYLFDEHRNKDHSAWDRNYARLFDVCFDLMHVAGDEMELHCNFTLEAKLIATCNFMYTMEIIHGGTTLV